MRLNFNNDDFDTILPSTSNHINVAGGRETDEQDTEIVSDSLTLTTLVRLNFGVSMSTKQNNNILTRDALVRTFAHSKKI